MNYSTQSKQDEKLVTRLVTVMKDYEPEIMNIYYVPKEENVAMQKTASPSLLVQTVSKGIQNIPILPNNMAVDSGLGRISEISRKVGLAIETDTYIDKKGLDEKYEDLIQTLQDANETSIMTLHEKEATAKMIDRTRTTLNAVLDIVGDKPARSNKSGFYVTDKVDAIEEIITSGDTPYHVVYKSPHCTIFGKTEPNPDMNPILVSSHADIVKNIHHPSSKLKKGFYHGTYDNMGTNATMTTLMLNNPDLPEDIFFALTDEEESFRCLGATESAKWLTGFTGNKPLCIALDVTDEGYFDNLLCSFEGLSAPKRIRDDLRDAMFLTEPEEQSFCVSKAKPEDFSPFPKDYISSQCTIMDESEHYASIGQNTLSFCLPTTGSMHSDVGLDVKEPVFIGYVLSLESLLYHYSYLRNHDSENETSLSIPSTHYTAAKEVLLDEAKALKKTYATSYNQYSNFIKNFDDYRDEEYQQEAQMATYMDYFGIEDPNDVNMGEISNYIENDIRDMVQMYTPGDLEVFLEDVDYNYGAGMVSQKLAKQIFMEEWGLDEEEDFLDYA